MAMRTALDHPDAVTHLAVLDCLPIVEHLERTDDRFATVALISGRPAAYLAAHASAPGMRYLGL